jgi:predicted nucleotidyltransferase
VFAPEDRERLRSELIAAAQDDARITAAALVGSAAQDREDRWSDIDLALRVEPEAERGAVIAAWTDRMYARHAAVHHTDVVRGDTLYRVFLLADTLQVDLSFWSASEFGAVGPAFRLVFGAGAKQTPGPAPTAEHLIGTGWLYALHVRSSIGRGQLWQAEYMVATARHHVLTLACLNRGLPTAHGRGFDRLPSETTARLVPALPRSLDVPDLQRALAAIVEVLLDETARADRALAERLREPLREVVGT